MHLDRESALTAAEPCRRLPRRCSTSSLTRPCPRAASPAIRSCSVSARWRERRHRLPRRAALRPIACTRGVRRARRAERLGELGPPHRDARHGCRDGAAVLRPPTAPSRRRLFATWWVIASRRRRPDADPHRRVGGVSRCCSGPATCRPAVALVGVALMAGIVQFVSLGVLRATGRPATYAALEGGALAVNAVLAVALLVVWRTDPTSVMLALAISWTGAAVVGLVLVRGSLSGRPSRDLARAILVLALPLAPAIVATWGADFFHRAYLLDVAGTTEAAYLSMATRIGSIAMLVVAAAQLAWHPHAYRLGTSDGAIRRLALEGRHIVVALVACVAVLGICTRTRCCSCSAVLPTSTPHQSRRFPPSVLAVGLFTVGPWPARSSGARRTSGDRDRRRGALAVRRTSLSRLGRRPWHRGRDRAGADRPRPSR